ncbi:MAG: NAD(P)-dependent oxidoreductase [Anaerolineae bacterium]|nr:NAD(P)-dependent oxidoreductase [Gemmatimonadaceae bacterium]
MRVLVTGGSGFIGRCVVAEARRRGHTVRILTRSLTHEPTDGGGGVEVVQHDLRQRDGLTSALGGMDAVVHCAASLTGGAEEQRDVTVEGTRNLLSAMREAEVRHIVGLSTLAVYDYQRIAAGAPLDETSPLEEDFDKRGPYIGAKRQQEELIRRDAISNGWRWTLVRPGIVFGRDRTWFHHLGMQLSATRWICLAKDSVLPITYVENCAEAIVLALDSDAAGGETLNIVDDDLPSRGHYIEELARHTQPTPKILSVPWDLLDAASRSASWVNNLLGGRAPLPDLLRSPSLHARCKPLYYPNKRAKSVLGWKPRLDWLQAMQRTFADRTEN